jgi:hypothetical protein
MRHGFLELISDGLYANLKNCPLTSISFAFKKKLTPRD